METSANTIIFNSVLNVPYSKGNSSLSSFDNKYNSKQQEKGRTVQKVAKKEGLGITRNL
ncbi:MAG: hypothetical protein ACXWE6_14680 [Nitrososphaeraceae archaeon]